VQRYGVGSTIQRINRSFYWDGSTDNFIPLRSFFTTVEFIDLARIFTYFKILCVKVVFLPNGTPYAGSDFYFKLRWAYLQEDNIDITLDDNAKLVPGGFLTRYKIFKFFPPRVNIKNEGYLVNFAEFNPTTLDVNTGYPRIDFYRFTDVESFSAKFFVEMDILFRGSRCTSPEATVSKFLPFLTKDDLSKIKDRIGELEKIEVKMDDPKELKPSRFGKPMSLLPEKVKEDKEEPKEVSEQESFGSISDISPSLNVSQASISEVLERLKKKIKNYKNRQRKKKKKEQIKLKEKLNAEEKPKDMPNNENESFTSNAKSVV
jgi:predicted DNA-binding protein YlxM (UPF0122 family)